MEQIGWIVCRLGAIVYWLIGLAIKYLWYAVPGAFKVIWNPRHAPTALALMLASALDVKLYDKIYLGKYNDWIHLAVILAPFVYFYYIGKHRKDIIVNKTIVIKEKPVHDPIKNPINVNKQRVNPHMWKKEISQPEFYARQAGDEVRNAKTIDYVEVDSEGGV